MNILLPFSLDTISEYPGGERGHQGVDFAVPEGSPVLSAFTGVVERVGDDGLGGLTVDVRRSDGLLCRDGHLSRAFVAVGDQVQQGDLLALSGWSGYVLPPGPSGAHLHREFRWDDLWNGGAWLDWAQIEAQGIIFSLPVVAQYSKEMEMLDSMYAVQDGVPCWCWMNYGTGDLVAVYTQKEADVYASVLGSVRYNFSKDKDGGKARYNRKVRVFERLTKSAKKK